jgi:hypothetical protein
MAEYIGLHAAKIVRKAHKVGLRKLKCPRASCGAPLKVYHSVTRLIESPAEEMQGIRDGDDDVIEISVECTECQYGAANLVLAMPKEG